jgi:hypothetical protein
MFPLFILLMPPALHVMNLFFIIGSRAFPVRSAINYFDWCVTVCEPRVCGVTARYF